MDTPTEPLQHAAIEVDALQIKITVLFQEIARLKRCGCKSCLLRARKLEEDSCYEEKKLHHKQLTSKAKSK